MQQINGKYQINYDGYKKFIQKIQNISFIYKNLPILEQGIANINQTREQKLPEFNFEFKLDYDSFECEEIDIKNRIIKEIMHTQD